MSNDNISIEEMLQITASGGNGSEYVDIPNLLEKAAAEITSLRHQLASARAAMAQEAAEKCEAVANPPKGRDCINLSPSGVCYRSGHRDCLCQEREEAADELRLAILALSPKVEGYVMVPRHKLKELAIQKLSTELDEDDYERADFEGGYDGMVETFRAMIAKG